MKVLVIGSTGGTGRAVVEQLLANGHQVTAFARRAYPLAHERLRSFAGDVTRRADVERAVAGHDAVIVTLGISENPIRVRLFGPARTTLDVRSVGTRNVIAAMHELGVRRLVVQTTYGVGATRPRLRWIERLVFGLLLRPQIADTEVQHQDVMTSGLDWVLVQPVHLTNATDAAPPLASTDGATGKMSVSRRSVARFMADVVADEAYAGAEVSLSGHAQRRLASSPAPAAT